MCFNLVAVARNQWNLRQQQSYLVVVAHLHDLVFQFEIVAGRKTISNCCLRSLLKRPNQMPYVVIGQRYMEATAKLALRFARSFGDGGRQVYCSKKTPSLALCASVIDARYQQSPRSVTNKIARWIFTLVAIPVKFPLTHCLKCN